MRSVIRKMKEKELSQLKALLEDQLADLVKKADSTVSELLALDNNLADFIDQATADTDRNFNLRIRDRESKLIKKIKTSLDRIDNGTYGICQLCGDDISMKRLMARPVTTYCIECKTRMEEDERLSGT